MQLPEVQPAYARDPVHGLRAEKIDLPPELKLWEKRLLFDSYCTRINMGEDPNVIEAPYVRYSFFHLFWSGMTSHFTPEEHFMLIHAYYWERMRFLRLGSLYPEIGLNEWEIAGYYNLNEPKLQESAERVEVFRESLRYVKLRQYYEELGPLSSSAPVLCAPILTNYGCLADVTSKGLAVYKGACTGICSEKNRRLADDDLLSAISNEERMMMNILEGPLRGSMDGSENDEIYNTLPMDTPFLQSTEADMEIRSITLQDISNCPQASLQLFLESEHFKLLKRVIDCLERLLKNETKMGERNIIEYLTHVCKEENELWREVLAIRNEKNGSTMLEMANDLLIAIEFKLLREVTSKEPISGHIYVWPSAFLGKSTVLITGDGEYGPPKICDLGHLELALEFAFSQKMKLSHPHK